MPTNDEKRRQDYQEYLESKTGGHEHRAAEREQVNGEWLPENLLDVKDIEE
jgi:hypothetical protein